MIRQINDRVYETKCLWENLQDIVSMLTEGERNIKIVYGDSIECEQIDFYIDGDALCFIMADAIRNARKYSAPRGIVTILFDYNGEELIVDCQNGVGNKYEPLTQIRIKKIFAREADQALKGFVSR